MIGRGGTADLALTDPSVSRRHTLVACVNGAWTARDLGSANGTFVNDRRVTTDVPLVSGDALRLGSVLITFTDDGRGQPALPDTTAIRLAPDDAQLPQVVLRVDATDKPEAAAAAEGGEAGGHWSLIAASLGRISTMMFDERALLEFAVEELLKLLPQAERAFVMLWDADLDRFVPSVARTRAGATTDIVASRTILGEVVARKEAVLIADSALDQRYAHAESIYALRMRAAVCAPILFRTDMFGVIQVDSTSGIAAFGRKEVALTLALASQVAIALAYARVHAKLIERELFERDLSLARKLQQHFLPAGPPVLAGFRFAMEYQPALAVGGDLYDFVPLADGRLAVAVGDVSGKGIAAALFAAKLASDIRHQAAAVTDGAALLRRLNQMLAARDHEGMFVTLAITVIDPKTFGLTVSSAGHPLPLVRDAAGHVAPIGRAGDAPLGVDAASTFAQYEYEIDPGDAVLLYTDGVLEALNAASDQYGSERLAATAGGGGSDPAGLVAAVSASVRAFAGGEPQSDDVTVVCFQRAGKSA